MSATDTPSTPVRLLVAYDGSDTAADAVRAAGRLFPGAQAEVTYVRRPLIGAEDAALARIAVPDGVIAAAAEQHEREVRARAEKLVEHGRSLADRAGLKSTTEIREASAAWRGIDQAARDASADVIVCGSRGSGPFSRALLGSTSLSLLYQADRSVLLLPPGAGELDGPMLIGYDGSDGAREAVDTVARLLRGRSAIVVHAWSSPLERSYAGESLALVPLPEVVELRQHVAEMFAGHSAELAEEGAARARDAGLDTRAVSVQARAGTWSTLAGSARSAGAALIVVGHRGRGAIASTVLGSVSAGLAHNAELPVLIVR